MPVVDLVEAKHPKDGQALAAFFCEMIASTMGEGKARQISCMRHGSVWLRGTPPLALAPSHLGEMVCNFFVVEGGNTIFSPAGKNWSCCKEKEEHFFSVKASLQRRKMPHPNQSQSGILT